MDSVTENKTRMLIGVKYTEGKPETYNGVTVDGGFVGGRFDSGDPRADMRAAIAYAQQYGEPLFLSSVDNFQTDAGVSFES